MHIKKKRKEHLNAEAKAVRQFGRLRVLRSLLLQTPALYKLGSNLMCKSITTLLTKNYAVRIGYDSINFINICYRNNIKLCSETIFMTDNLEEILA